MKASRVAVAIDIVLFTLREGALTVHLEERDGGWALPEGRLVAGESLAETARRVLKNATGLSRVYLEQLYTYGAPADDPRGHGLSVTYFAIAPDAESRGLHPAHRPPPLAFDHGRILSRAVERLRTKTEYSTVPLRFLREPFTLSEVQAVYETLLRRPLDKRNFRRKMLALEALEETDGYRREGAHRPARLFRLSPSHPHLLKEKGILFPF